MRPKKIFLLAVASLLLTSCGTPTREVANISNDGPIVARFPMPDVSGLKWTFGEFPIGDGKTPDPKWTGQAFNFETNKDYIREMDTVRGLLPDEGYSWLTTPAEADLVLKGLNNYHQAMPDEWQAHLSAFRQLWNIAAWKSSHSFTGTVDVDTASRILGMPIGSIASIETIQYGTNKQYTLGIYRYLKDGAEWLAILDGRTHAAEQLGKAVPKMGILLGIKDLGTDKPNIEAILPCSRFSAWKFYFTCGTSKE